MPDENLKRFATTKQWEYLLAREKHGSATKAADALGMHRRTMDRAIQSVEHKAAKHGYSPDHDMNHTVPDGFKLKGTSTLYDEVTGEPKIQWVKSTADNERQMEMMREAIEAMAETLPRVKPIKSPKANNDNYLTEYIIADHHIGMLATAEETGGENYDLKRAEQLLFGAVDDLTRAAPDSKEAAILVLGDFLHYDGTPVTPTSKNMLDADSRAFRMVRVAIRCVRYAIDRALQTHKHVRVIIEAGNHDLYGAIFLREALAALYEKEPRISIDTSPQHFHCFTFGKNLIGVHHGHGTKIDKLPIIFASRWPVEWGSTLHRTIHTGHIHHDQTKDWANREFDGASVESHRILAPQDAWHVNSGYNSGRSMKAIVLHKEYGERTRITVNPGMIDANESQ